MQTLRTSVTIIILAYCLLALGELSSVYKIKSDFSLHSKLSDHSDKSGQPRRSERSERSERSGLPLPAKGDLSGEFEYHQQTRISPLESGIFVSIQKIWKTQRTTITSHDEMAFIDLSCFDNDVRQLDPSATQRSPKNDFFFC